MFCRYPKLKLKSRAFIRYFMEEENCDRYILFDTRCYWYPTAEIDQRHSFWLCDLLNVCMVSYRNFTYFAVVGSFFHRYSVINKRQHGSNAHPRVNILNDSLCNFFSFEHENLIPTTDDRLQHVFVFRTVIVVSNGARVQFFTTRFRLIH